MIIDCIADLHGEYPELEGGDLLIVAGDLTGSDKLIQYGNFAAWLSWQHYKKKILIAGNHDGFYQAIAFDKIQEIYKDIGVEYLCDSGTEFSYLDHSLIKNGPFTGESLRRAEKKLKIWGSPWTLSFEGLNPHCAAFTGTEDEIEAKFALIPDDIDILVTHGPPYTILDKTKRGANVGSVSLLGTLNALRPKLHVFGHIHEGHGQIRLKHWPLKGHANDICHVQDTICVNCSLMNEDYEPVNKPIRIIL